MSISLTEEQIEELGELYGSETIEFDGHTYQLHWKSDETNEGKIVSWETVYKRSDDKYFIQYNSKSGSYFSDYEFYLGEDLYEVELKEVIKTEWRHVE